MGAPARDWLSEHYVFRNKPKKSYATFAEAMTAASEAQERERPKHPFRAYKCGYCDGFHVGKSQPDDRKRGRR